MPAAVTEWTIDMLDALPESSERHEIIDGQLYVTPSPGLPHQGVVLDLAMRLRQYTLDLGVGRTVVSPSDVWRSDRKKNRVQPDVYVVRLTESGTPVYPFHLRELILAVEVASPGNPVLDYQVKRDLFLREGLPEYWIFNVEARNVSRWRGREDPGEVLSRTLEWRPDGAATPLVIDLPAFFDLATR